jgi:predicted CoA-binding protein
VDQTPATILAAANTIAVVGASRHDDKAAYSVPLQMKIHGWRVIPINPYADRIWGEKAYPSLRALVDSGELTEAIDIVNVFRPSDQAAAVVKEAIDVGARAVWLQQDIVSPEGRELARAAGITYVENNCMAVTRAVWAVSKTFRE